MRDKPVSLNLFTIKYPATAIASICHRISGALLFLMLPVFLSMLHTIKVFPEHFAAMQGYKIVALFTLGFLNYHLFAGIRHLVMDMGFGESLFSSRISAYFTFIASIGLTAGLGILLCC